LINLEKIILKNLLNDIEYARKVLPFLKSEYFSDTDKILFQNIEKFILKYNQVPTKDSLKIETQNLGNITDSESKKILESIDDIGNDKEENVQWILDKTENFCQEKAIYNAMMQSIEVMNNPKGTVQKGAIPKLLSDALAVSFDPNVGHDYFINFDDRYKFYHKKEEKLPFDIELLNKITSGGIPKKTLNIILAGCVHPDTKVKIRYRKKV